MGEDLVPAFAGAVDQRVGEQRGVEVAVGGQVGRAAHAVGDHQREQLLGLLGREQLERQPEGLGPGDLAQHLLLALLGARQPDAAALHPAAVQLAVELHRVHHHPRQRDAAAQLADQPGGVKRRAAGELVAVQHDDIALAALGEVVGDRGAPDPTADDDHAGAGGEVAGPNHLEPRPGSGVGGRRSHSARPGPRDAWPGEVPAGVPREIKVELGDDALDHAPGGLPGVGHDSHQGQGRPAFGVRRLAVVGLEQAVLGGRVELVVDGQVAEIEQPMAHSGVLPVDEDCGRRIAAAGEEVGREQIVVAGDGIGERQDLGDASGQFARRPIALGQRVAGLGDDPFVVGQELGDPETGRQPQLGVVKGAQGARRRRGGGPQLIGIDRLTRDELGDQVPVPGRHQGGSDAQAGRLRGGQAFGLTVDPEQSRAGTGQAQDTFTFPEAHPEVAIGDAAVQRHGARRRRSRAARRELANDRARERSSARNLAVKAQFLYLPPVRPLGSVGR